MDLLKVFENDGSRRVLPRSSVDDLTGPQLFGDFDYVWTRKRRPTVSTIVRSGGNFRERKTRFSFRHENFRSRI